MSQIDAVAEQGPVMPGAVIRNVALGVRKSGHVEKEMYRISRLSSLNNLFDYRESFKEH